MLKKLVIIFSLSLTPVAVAETQQSEEMKLAVKQLLEVTQSLALMEQMVPNMVQQFVSIADQNSSFTDNERAILVEEVSDLFQNDFLDLAYWNQAYLDIYAKYFTVDEIQEMIGFYQTKTGQKALKASPLVMQDAMLISELRAQSLLPLLEQRMSERLHGTESDGQKKQ